MKAKEETTGTPLPQDIPKPADVSIGLAGEYPPDIARFLHVRSANAPTISPDGERVAFRTAITGSPQLWVVESNGKAWPDQLTFGESVSFAEWSPSGEWIVYGADRSGNEREGYYLLSPCGTKERELLPLSEVFRVWGGWSRNGSHIAYASTEPGSSDFNIYIMDINEGAPQCVYRSGGGVFVAGWRPTGDGLLLAKIRGADANDIYYLNLKTGEVHPLLLPDEASAHLSFTWTPDSKGFYFTTNSMRDFAALAHYDMESQQMRWIETPDHDVESVALSHDGRFLAWVENVNGFSELRLRNLKSNHTSTIDQLPSGVIHSIKWASDVPRLVIELTSPKIPGDIWTYDAEINTLTRTTYSSTAGLNAENFIEPKAVSFLSHDQLEIHGLLYMPNSSPKQDKSLPPVVLNLHGGPTMQARPKFDPVHQYLLAHGFAVYDLNYRGSTGFGKRFMRLDDGRLRMNAVLDMEAAIDWLEREGLVDTGRVAVMGVSYGGFMALAALTNFPDKFNCGINFVGVSNWITALKGASPQLKASDATEFGDLNDPEDYEFLQQLSPLTHVAKIKAPLMVVHGANDPRDPVSEADQLVQAVRERGGEVEYLRFPDEGHGIRKLSNRIIAYRHVVQFLQKLNSEPAHP